MLKFAPILIAAAYGYLMFRFSAARAEAELDSQSRKLDDPRLTPLIERMAAAMDLPHIEVFLYEIDAINGLAGHNGKVYLTRGLIHELNAGRITAAELASVIAHELGHLSLGHTKRRMVDFTGQNAMRAALGLALARILPGISGLVANLLTALISARLSREDEFEADAFATALLIKSRIGTAGQKSLFAKLDAITGARHGLSPAWLLSHPGNADRIAAIEANEAKWLGV